MRKIIPYIGTADLSAYLDGELIGDRRRTVQRALDENPELAERVSEYRRRDSALRRAFNEISVPTAISLPRRVRVFGWWTSAAAVACCAVLVGASWLYEDFLARNRELAGFMHDAAAAHILYLQHDGFEIGPIQASPELTRLLGGDSKSPDLSAFGFHLVGKRKMPDEERPAILFAYRDQRGDLISCYFRLAHGSRETPFLSGEEAGFQVAYRLTPQLDYAVVGTLPPEQLQRIADAADAGIADD